MQNIPFSTNKKYTGSSLRALAFALLAKREYSKTDLQHKLLTYQTDQAEVDHLIEELAQSHYQSDERMAGILVRSQVRQGRGPQRIQQAFKKHDIDAELAQEELEQVDWFEQALQLKIRKFGEDIAHDPKQKAKQIRFLQYRGFSMDVIMKVIQYRQDEDF